MIWENHRILGKPVHQVPGKPVDRIPETPGSIIPAHTRFLTGKPIKGNTHIVPYQIPAGRHEKREG